MSLVHASVGYLPGSRLVRRTFSEIVQMSQTTDHATKIGSYRQNHLRAGFLIDGLLSGIPLD